MLPAKSVKNDNPLKSCYRWNGSLPPLKMKGKQRQQQKSVLRLCSSTASHRLGSAGPGCTMWPCFKNIQDNVLGTFLQVSSRAITLHFFIISENRKNEHEIYHTNSIYANYCSLGVCNSHMLPLPCLFVKNSYLHAVCSVETVPECLAYSCALSIVSSLWT